jgi:dTDP-4-dehydrorhamnose 3,5-epimerase
MFPSDVLILPVSSFSDDRGNLDVIFEKEISDSISLKRSTSKKFVFRGMHFQTSPSMQKKVIQVLSGTVLDIIINMDINSDYYGQIYKKIINSDDNEVIHIPPHYAHGFIALTETVFQYMTFGKYSPDNEISLKLPLTFFEEENIDLKKLIISHKDLNAIPYDKYFLK